MICRNCGGEVSEGTLECPYCGTENTKKAEEQQREYVQEYQNKKEELKKMPYKIAKKGKRKATKILFFALLAAIIIGIIAFFISKIIGNNALKRQDEQLAKLEELYQAKDFENLEIYYKKYNVRDGYFEKYERIIELYSCLYMIESLKSTCEFAKSYPEDYDTSNLEERIADIFEILHRIKEYEDKGFVYQEEEGVLYFKELYTQALKEYALLSDEEIAQGILDYADEDTDYSALSNEILLRLSE